MPLVKMDAQKSAGGGGLSDAQFVFSVTPSSNGTQTITVTFSKVPSDCILYVTNADGNQLSVTASGATLTTTDTDNATYLQGALSAITAATVDLTITHNRAGVNQPAQVVCVYK